MYDIWDTVDWIFFFFFNLQKSCWEIQLPTEFWQIIQNSTVEIKKIKVACLLLFVMEKVYIHQQIVYATYFTSNSLFSLWTFRSRVKYFIQTVLSPAIHTKSTQKSSPTLSYGCPFSTPRQSPRKQVRGRDKENQGRETSSVTKGVMRSSNSNIQSPAPASTAQSITVAFSTTAVTSSLIFATVFTLLFQHFHTTTILYIM